MLRNQGIPVRAWSLAICKGELSAVVVQLMLNVREVGGSDRKELESTFSFPYCPVSRECSVKENPDRKTKNLEFKIRSCK